MIGSQNEPGVKSRCSFVNQTDQPANQRPRSASIAVFVCSKTIFCSFPTTTLTSFPSFFFWCVDKEADKERLTTVCDMTKRGGGGGGGDGRFRVLGFCYQMRCVSEWMSDRCLKKDTVGKKERKRRGWQIDKLRKSVQPVFFFFQWLSQTFFPLSHFVYWNSSA